MASIQSVEKRNYDATRSSAWPRGLGNAALLVVLFWGINAAELFLVPVCVAAMLAFLLAPLVRLLKAARAPEWLAITASAILLLLPFSVIGIMLIDQGQALIRDFPRIVRSLDRMLSSFSNSAIAHQLNLSAVVDLTTLTNRLAQRAGQGIQILLTGLGALLNAGSITALVLLFTVLMLAARTHLRQSGETILARAQYVEAAAVLDEVSLLIERFLLSRVFIVLIIGGADLVILLAFGIGYAALLAAFLGVMTLVPAIGFILAVIPPIVVALTTGHSPLATVLLVGALFVMSIIEGNVLTPKMAGKSINLNVMTTFVGLFAGSLLWGLWGMFLAIPIMGIVRIAFSASPGTAAWGDLMSDKPVTRATRPRLEPKSHRRRPPEAGHA